MATDDSKLNYLSTWDIDQLVETNTALVGTGATAIYTIPSTSVPLPVYEVQLLASGKWYQAGVFSPPNTVIGEQVFFTYISGNSIFINTNLAGTARYFVWTDKVNY